MTDETKANLRAAALQFHEHPRPGKVELTPTKPLANSRDLALAYSPGVAAPCEEIAEDPPEILVTRIRNKRPRIRQHSHKTTQQPHV